MTNLALGAFFGIIVSGVIRLNFGTFVIYQDGGWVWKWDPISTEDRKTINLLKQALRETHAPDTKET